MHSEVFITICQAFCWLQCDHSSRYTTDRARASSFSLLWRHNGRDGISNHQPHDCLLNSLFRRRSKKISKLRVTGLCARNSPVTGEFPAQTASCAKRFSFDDVIMEWFHLSCHRKMHANLFCFHCFLCSVTSRVAGLMSCICSTRFPWRLHAIEIFSRYWLFVGRNPPTTVGFSPQRAINAEFWGFFCSLSEKTDTETIELPMIWNVSTLMWR